MRLFPVLLLALFPVTSFASLQVDAGLTQPPLDERHAVSRQIVVSNDAAADVRDVDGRGAGGRWISATVTGLDTSECSNALQVR